MVEKFAVVGLGLLAVSAVILGVVEGISSSHHEHVVMAIVTGLVFGQFAAILRLYRQDVLQSTKLVYYSWCVTLMVSACTLMYATNWGIVPPTAEQQALTTCESSGLYGAGSSCYNSALGAGSCMKFPTSMTGGGAYVPPRGNGTHTPLNDKCFVFGQGLPFTWQKLFQIQSGNVTAAGIGLALNGCGLQADHCLKQGLENATLRCNNGRAPTIRPRLDALPPTMAAPTMAAPTMAAPTMPTTPTP